MPSNHWYYELWYGVLSIAYLGHIFYQLQGYNVYRRITYVTFTPITWFVLLWFCNGWMLEFVIELFEMKTMHVIYLCCIDTDAKYGKSDCGKFIGVSACLCYDMIYYHYVFLI